VSGCGKRVTGGVAPLASAAREGEGLLWAQAAKTDRAIVSAGRRRVID
jgi:hypothetical protein